MIKSQNKIVLGTAQFGLNYGINNNNGKLSEQEVFKILETALENAVYTLDTAFSYGDSEVRIGKFIKATGKNFNIISKMPPVESCNDVEKFLDQSLSCLNQSYLYCCLVHDFKSFQNNFFLWEELKRLKYSGKIKKTGFSLYYKSELEYLLENSIDFDIVQVPYNILDQRFLPYFPILKEKNIEVHVRSVFLQGLFFKDPYELSDYFLSIKSKITWLRNIAIKNKILLEHLCLNFVALNKFVDKIVVGVDSVENFITNVSYDQHIMIAKKVYSELEVLRENNKKIILPTNWQLE